MNTIQYSNKTITDIGNQLFTQASAKGLGVVIDSMVISNKQPQVELSNLDSSFFDLSLPINARNIVGNSFQVESVVYNTNFQTDYDISVVGIVGHMSGIDDSILIAVASADEPITIPAASDIKYTQYVDFSITNDKAANITAEVNTAGLVSNDTFDKTVDSLNTAASNYATNSMLTSYATTNSLASYATTSQLSSVISNIPSSFNVNSLSGFATTSSVSTQIASTESYANSVAISAAIGSTNWVNTLPAGTDLNTTIGVGRYVLVPNGNYINWPAELDATQQGYMNVIPDVYGNVSQQIMVPGNHVEAIRFKQPNGWVNWSITATLNDNNNAYQNAVNTASNNVGSLMSSANSTINSLTSIANSLVAKFPPLPAWIPSYATHLTSGQLDYLPQQEWYYLAPNDLANGQYTHVPTGNYALDNTQYYLLYYNPYNASFNLGGRTFSNSQVYIFNDNGPWTEATLGGNSWSNGF